MAFRVVVTQKAQLDIDEHTQYIAEDSPTAAARWKAELQDLILSLDEMPSRFSIIPESERLKLPYRSALHYSHRVIFRVDEAANTVYVSRVYHGFRKPINRREML